MAGTTEPHASAFSAAELEFLAEDELIEIVPNLRMDPLNFISGDFGHFRPQIATQVPLWLAVALKKRGKCTIRAPGWMSVDKLAHVLEAERDSQKFQPLPFHYVEISRLLFDHAREDIPDNYMVRSLIEDIKDVRFHKIGTGLDIISQERTYALRVPLQTGCNLWFKLGPSDRVLYTTPRSDGPDYILPKLKHLSAMEANIVRPFITRALETFYKLSSPEMIQESDDVPNRQPQATNRGPRRQLKDR